MDESHINSKINFASIVKKFWPLFILFIVLFMIIFWLVSQPKTSADKKEKDVKSEDIGKQTRAENITCPKSISYKENDPLPIADFDGQLKQLSSEDVIKYHNDCPNLEITSTLEEQRETEKETQGKISASQTSQAPGENRASSVEETSVSTATDQPASPTTSTEPAPIEPTPATQTSTSQNTNVQSLTLDPGSVITPYLNESDISSVNEAFSLNQNNPYWGFWHPGVDFMVMKDIDVRAAVAGTIENLAIEKSDGLMGWHAGFCINTGTDNSVCYNLETFAATDEVEQSLRDNMLIANGDTVTQGEIIGKLIYGNDGAHIDFGVTAPGTRVCPETYFTDSARESVLRLIHKSQPSWPMCDNT